MPSFNIIKESDIDNDSFRVQSVIGQFDLKIDKVREQFHGNIAIENESWQIGIIVGASGSGKTTIAKTILPQYYIDGFKYDANAVIDNMPQDLTTQEIIAMFNNVGFSTVWSWLKPYHVLSNGEKMRVDLARALLEKRDLICFDEYTSVVDRTVAKTASYALSKAIRKTSKQLVCVACHRDIIEWLEPDWVYDTDEQRFFFANNSTNDLQCESKFVDVRQKYGHCLESITI